MLTEAALTLRDMPGIGGLQEIFDGNRAGPAGYTALGGDVSSVPSGMVRQLPFSVDLMQIFWARKAAERLYSATRLGEIAAANRELAEQGLLGGERRAGEPTASRQRGHARVHAALPGLSAAQRVLAKRAFRGAVQAALWPVGTAPSAEKPAVPIERVSGIAEDDIQALREQASAACGHEAGEQELQAYLRNLMGTSYTYGVKGDVYDLATWREHALRSLVDRGFSDADPDASACASACSTTSSCSACASSSASRSTSST